MIRANNSPLIGILLVGMMASGCVSSRHETTATQPGSLPRLGAHSFKVTTNSREAQRAFDRGLTLAYGFSHHAAEQEFRRAASADPNCAMAYWGIALVNGPHINYPLVPPDRAAKAWEALTNATARVNGLTPLERDLIKALGQRYANPQPEDRSSLDTAYADAMRELWRAYPDNADVGTLFAEAAMDLHPWDLWDNQQPRTWTPEILQALERAIVLNPKHPGAHHLYIHAVEASPHPEKALSSADRLGGLVPHASHLVHMPSHIYARVGQWNNAAQSNRDAMKADAVYRSAYPRPGFYAMYMTHNTHFLAFVAMMQGNSDEALRCARKLVSDVPEDFIRDYAGVADGFMIFVSEVLMRFGRWDEILQEPEPRPGLPLSRAMWHFTRASALTALNRMEEAQTERAAFQKASAAVPQDWRFGNNSAKDILAVAAAVLDGEMSAKVGHYSAAIASLREGVRLEDNLQYDEPPDWIQPVRHTLGAVLLKAGQPAEAEQVYREDLRKFPENGWSLMGLRDALEQQGKDTDAKMADRRFKKAWARADIQPPSSCYCQTAAK